MGFWRSCAGVQLDSRTDINQIRAALLCLPCRGACVRHVWATHAFWLSALAIWQVSTATLSQLQPFCMRSLVAFGNGAASVVAAGGWRGSKLLRRFFDLWKMLLALENVVLRALPLCVPGVYTYTYTFIVRQHVLVIYTLTPETLQPPRIHLAVCWPLGHVFGLDMRLRLAWEQTIEFLYILQVAFNESKRSSDCPGLFSG